MENNFFKRKSSKIEPLHIPVPNFKYFHKPSSEEEVDKSFIGREEISEQLTDWLKNGETGSYLVSGYRGMGKSSFVGKVLNEITDTNQKKWFKYFFVILCFLFVVFLGIILVSFCTEVGFQWFHEHFINKIELLNSADKDSQRLSIIFITLIISIGALFILILILIGVLTSHCKIRNLIKRVKLRIDWRILSKGKEKNLNRKEFCKQNKNWTRKVYGIINKKSKKEKRKAKERIVIKINLGHEILNERDILSLIAKKIHSTYQDHVHDIYIHPVRIGLKFAFFSAISAFIFFLLFGLEYQRLWDSKFMRDYIRPIKDFIDDNIVLTIGANILIITGVFLTVKFIYNKVIHLVPFLNKTSSGAILKDLKHLTDRIDTTVNENIGPNAGYNHSSSLIGISLFRSKNKTYSLANVREIETELIQILDRIQNLPFCRPGFIIVFDELDKIDPEYNYDTNLNKDANPEYENSSDGFPSSMVSRKRKQSVLKLLGNMKLFISSAKAKFIFISGRELYDAYLADLSDREFAISSVFNGAIYVDSFFESTTNQKNIISKTEEYICGKLIPKKYYRKEAKKRFRKNIHDRFPPNLRLYKQFLKENFEDQLKNNDKNICETYEFFINKTILFLSQFSVYLSHISNGSPKKMALSFEKYIGHFYAHNEKNMFRHSKYISIKDSEYCLSFSILDQQSIGFIHYIAYPVIQAIINKSSQYGDKLLVSASFLVDQIYKHHKGGFSRDNIEHVPELLEVYRTPELRDFISSIISFLRQTHLTNISSGLYYYKFRKWVSYEISYFSKISEEISAVFNFTLDESSSVKRHYMRQVEYYVRLYTQHIEECENSIGPRNPYSMTLIQLYGILGEFHLLDDEFEDAIMIFQNGLQLIKSELNFSKKETQGSATNEQSQLMVILLMIKNILKLGLTYECQRTYNLAYAVYCELVTYLIGFRYVEEKELGLSYAYENTNTWKKEIVFYHEKGKEYHGTEQPEDLFLKEGYPDTIEFEDNEQFFSVKQTNIDYYLSANELISGLSTRLTPNKNSIISRLTLFEDVQFMYQVILAKLFVLEKIDLNGITKTNVDVAENEFAYLYLATNINDKFLLAADFYRKFGAILYLKNGITGTKNVDKFYSIIWDNHVKENIQNFCYVQKFSPGNNLIAQKVLIEYIEYLSGDRGIGVKLKRLYNEIKKDYDNQKDRDFEQEAKELFIEKIKEWEKCKNEKVHVLIEDFFRSKHFSFPSFYRYEKILHCLDHQKEMRKEGVYLPCYACTFFSRSLGILSKHLLRIENNDSKFDEVSNIVKFIKGIYSRSRISNQRVSYLVTIASTLRAMGDVQLSCSKRENVIGTTFLRSFFEMISEMIQNRLNNNLESISISDLKKKFNSISKLEKSILYYWTASKYFKMASSAKDTVECLRKILQILVSYTRHATDRFDEDQLKNIKIYIFQEAIINCYTEYDNINIAEIQHLKWTFDIENINKIALNKLSNFPDIEELIFLFCELELQNGALESSIDCYNSIILSPFRMESSVYEKVFSMHFKALMNKKILGDFVEKCSLEKFDFHSSGLPYDYFKFLFQYMENFDLSTSSFKKCVEISNIQVGEKKDKGKIDVLEFLIFDSIFCLAQVTEVLSSAQVSQFTNSFIADIYHQLFDWSQLYRFHDILLNDMEKGGVEYIKRLAGIVKKREEAISNIKNDEKYYIQKIKDANYEDIKGYSILNETSPEGKEKRILKLIGKGNRHLLTPNYSAEMAIKYYTKALETHAEGASYKEMISNMYLVDDDVNNANTTFSLAIERYAINSGEIKEKMSKLKCIYSNASYYDLDGYIKAENNI